MVTKYTKVEKQAARLVANTSLFAKDAVEELGISARAF